IIRAAWDPDTCPVHLLPHLAAAWSVDEWDPEWDEATRRRVIKSSPDIHRVKGTVGALKRALTALGWGATVSQWFEHAGAPYTFRLRVAVPGFAEWTARQTGILMRTAIATKNVRSHLDRVTIARVGPATPIALGCAVVCRVRTRLVVEPVRAIRTPRIPIAIGAAVIARVKCRISPYAA
ncbi:MAG: phage tail protein I, partial [Hyphomicrobium sp.]